MWPSNSRQNHPRNYFTISRSSLSRCFLSFFWVLAIVSASRANTNDKASFFGVFCIVRTTKTSSSFTCFDVDLWVLSWWFAVALMLISSCCDIDWCFWDSKYGRILSWGFKFVFADLSVFFCLAYLFHPNDVHLFGNIYALFIILSWRKPTMPKHT